MRTSCPHCQTVFRVDPAKIPAGGARARCSVCEGVFRVSAAASQPAAAPSIVSPAAAPSTPASAPPAAASRPAAAASTAAPAAAAPAPPAATSGAAVAPPPRFGTADPDARARRLARALVSDMVMYHPDRRERALAQGTLKQEFAEEIRKSWEEYVTQIGSKAAYGTPHFREALNEILARGAAVF